LSQILVDNKRAKQDPSDTLLTQILSRGGDALYSAIRKSVDDATEGLGDFQDHFRNLVGQAESTVRGKRGFAWDRRPGGGRDDGSGSSRDSRSSTRSSAGRRADDQSDQPDQSDDDLAGILRTTVSEVIESLDLPRRRDLEELNRNFERVAKAVERLERAYLPAEQVSALASKRTEKPQ
jgi:hypothetical protein